MMLDFIPIPILVLVGIVLYGIYQLFWYYPRHMRALFGIEKFATEQEIEERSTGSDRILHNTRTLAHRGCRTEGLPENSLAAFEYALTKGKADLIECDVWLTKDGEIAIQHDDTLERMTGKNARMCELNYDELPPLKTDIPHQCEKITEYLSTLNHKLENVTRIPTLRQVLELLPPNRFLTIEFKQLSSELVLKVHDLVHSMGKEKQIYWFSLDEKINSILRLHNDRIPSINSVKTMLAVLFYYYVGILPFIHLPDKVFCVTVDEIPMHKIQEEKDTKDLPLFVQKILHWLFQGRPPWPMVSKKLFTHLRRRGIPVWFMGVNSDEDLKLAFEFGVTGILTDKIDWLTTALEKMEKSGQHLKKLYE